MGKNNMSAVSGCCKNSQKWQPKEKKILFISIANSVILYKGKLITYQIYLNNLWVLNVNIKYQTYSEQSWQFWYLFSYVCGMSETINILNIFETFTFWTLLWFQNNTSTTLFSYTYMYCSKIVRFFKKWLTFNF